MKQPYNIDQLALENLEEKLGFTLEGERTVHFYFYFTEEHQSHHAAATLTNLHLQFDTEISYSDYRDQWLCLAMKNLNMTSERLMNLRSWMEDLAQQNGGEYDGWETMLEPEDD